MDARHSSAVGVPPLSARARQMLALLFAENSNLQLPVGVAAEIVELRAWLAAQDKEPDADV